MRPTTLPTKPNRRHAISGIDCKYVALERCVLGRRQPSGHSSSSRRRSAALNITRRTRDAVDIHAGVVIGVVVARQDFTNRRRHRRAPSTPPPATLRSLLNPLPLVNHSHVSYSLVDARDQYAVDIHCSRQRQVISAICIIVVFLVESLLQRRRFRLFLHISP